jgi:acetyl esterase/lipase
LAVGLTALLALAGCSSDDGGRAAIATTTTAPAPTTTTAPAVPVSIPARTSEIGPTAAAELAPTPVEVAYGPDPMQKMNVYATSGESLGTIMYIHGGGWNGGSKDANTAPVVLSTQGDLRNAASPLLAEVDATAGQRLIYAQIQNGWDVVSIDYRLASSTAGPGIRAPELLNDVDRAVRYTRAHAGELGLNMHKFVLSGGSAGGHLALMETLGAPSNAFADPTLPPDLASTKPHIDATIGLVAPTDMSTFWMAGGIAPPSSESLLGCTQDVTPAIPGMPACAKKVVDDTSPLVRTRGFANDGRALPPAYFAYGGDDAVVKIETQGLPNIEAWTKAAGPGRTYVDLPPKGTHNIDDEVNYIAFNAWLARVASGNWSTTPPKLPTTTSTPG